ncbi:MAG: Hsp20/alpha crystallin family protein [Desulfitobacterium hafniense]|nr:Hsp20/alpha crystallin family protein [Desulfitobacterium hafniense]
MPLVPYDPFRMFDPFREEMERFFRRSRGREELSDWLYRVDVEETKDQVYVTIEIPGIERKEDLHIQLDENLLTIEGEIKRLTEDEKRTSHYSERYYGRFSRTITLPALVKTDGAHASYKNGILELSFLKDNRPAARQIEVDFH